MWITSTKDSLIKYQMKKLFVILFLSLLLISNSYGNENRYSDYKSKLSIASSDEKFEILKEISFALEFENDILSSCVSYIKMWKEIKGETCERAFKRIGGIKNLLDVQVSSEYKSSFKEISKKIDEYKLNKLMNETSKNNSALTDTFTKLNFLIKNL